jgi:hypothetical protein
VPWFMLGIMVGVIVEEGFHYENVAWVAWRGVWRAEMDFLVFGYVWVSVSGCDDFIVVLVGFEGGG